VRRYALVALVCLIGGAFGMAGCSQAKTKPNPREGITAPAAAAGGRAKAVVKGVQAGREKQEQLATGE
jgi:hypothetical protein